MAVVPADLHSSDIFVQHRNLSAENGDKAVEDRGSGAV
jgi:hypothetical protein